MLILPPTTTPRTRIEMSSFVIATIEKLGVPVPPSSRLRSWQELYHSGSPTIEPDHPEYESAIEGERDMQLLAFAFDQLAQIEPTDEFRKCLSRVVIDADSVLPQHDKMQSAGRDAAFEVYVGAVCAAAKLLPVKWEEPDLTCELDGTKFGFAAKRLKSLGQLRKRVRDGVDQIKRSGLPGVIVLDMARALNPDNHRIRQMPDAVFWSQYQENFKVTWSEYQPKIQESLSRANVLGIVVHDYHIRRQGADWQLTGMTIRIPSENQPKAAREQFERLSSLYTFGLPNQSDASNQPIILPGR